MANVQRPLRVHEFLDVCYSFHSGYFHGSFQEQKIEFPDPVIIKPDGWFGFSTKVFTIRRNITDANKQLLSAKLSGRRFNMSVGVRKITLNGTFVVVGSAVTDLDRGNLDIMYEILYLMPAPGNPIQWLRYIWARYVKPVK